MAIYYNFRFKGLMMYLNSCHSLTSWPNIFNNVCTPPAYSSAKVCTTHLKNGQRSNSQAWSPTLTYLNSLYSTICVSVFTSSGEESHRNGARDTDKHTQVNAPDLPQLFNESDWIYDCLYILRWPFANIFTVTHRLHNQMTWRDMVVL